MQALIRAAAAPDRVERSTGPTAASGSERAEAVLAGHGHRRSAGFEHRHAAHRGSTFFPNKSRVRFNGVNSRPVKTRLIHCIDLVGNIGFGLMPAALHQTISCCAADRDTAETVAHGPSAVHLLKVFLSLSGQFYLGKPGEGLNYEKSFI